MFFLYFLFWRVCDLIVAYIAHIFDRYHEHFAYRFQLYHHNPYIPPFLLNFANYDGANYLHIAHSGYGMYEQAYFPLFPMLVRILAPLFGYGYFLGGFFIANMSFFFGLYFFKKYLKTIGKSTKSITWIFLFLIAYPMSFFFGAVYTEGLFFLLVTGTLYFSQKKQYGRVIVFCLLAALTRLMGVFLFIPLLATILLEQQHFRLNQKTLQMKITYISRFIVSHCKLVPVLIVPFLGLLAYMVYLLKTVHDPFFFYHAVAQFHTGRTTGHIIFLPQVYYRYLSIFFRAQHNFIYFVAVIEFILFNLFFFVLLYDLWLLWKKKDAPARISLIGLNLFSLVNLLLPTLTGTMTSLPRYALFSLSFFIRIAEIKPLWLKISLFIIFLLFHCILLNFFIQGYFVS